MESSPGYKPGDFIGDLVFKMQNIIPITYMCVSPCTERNVAGVTTSLPTCVWSRSGPAHG